MRKWLKRVVIGLLALVALVLLLWGAVYIHGRSMLSAEVALWREMGVELRTDHNTANESDPRLDRAMMMYDEVPVSYRSIVDDYSPDKPEALAEAVEAYADVLVQIHEITADPRGAWGGKVSLSITDLYDLIDRLGSSRRAIRLLAAEATVYAQSGDMDSASDSIEAGLVVARQVSEHHALIALLTTAAIDHAMIGLIETLYAQGGLPAESTMKVLREVDYRADIPSMLEREAELYLQVPEVYPGSPWVKYDMAYALGQYRRVILSILADDVPLRELAYEMDPPWWAYLYKVSAVAFDTSTEALARSQARVGLAKTAILLRQYKVEHGAYPTGLDELADISTDPWTGEAFDYRREGEGFVLTSAGDYDGDSNDWHWEK